MASSTRTVNVKFDGSAKGLMAAAKNAADEIDKFGKGTEEKFRKTGDKSGKGFGAGLKKWFKGDGDGLFKEIGKSGGTVFGSGLLGALKTPILGPAIVALLAAAFTTSLPAVGAIAAGALVTGFGAGLAGLGIVAASKSAVVGAAWKKTMAKAGADVRLLSKPFESTLVNIAGYFERTVNRFGPALGKSFAKMAPTVDKFVNGTAHSLERLIPAIDPITDAFDGVLASLTPALDSAIGDISDELGKLADSVAKNPEALADLVDGLGQIVGLGLSLLTTLNNVNGAFERITGGTSLVTAVMDGLAFPLKIVNGYFEKFNELMGKLPKNTKAAGDAVGYTGEMANFMTQGLDAGALAAMGITGAVGPAAAKVESLATKFERQWRATQKANEELFRNSGLLLTLSGAQIGYEEAVDRATASVKENGRTHDINTEKGRANKRALDDVANAAKAQTEAMINAGDGNVSAAKHAEGARASFVKQAIQMGYSKKEAEAMAKSLIDIPNVSRTAKLTANKKDLEAKLAAANKALKDPNLTKERKAKLTVDKKNAEAGIAQINTMLGNLPKSKTITVTTKLVTVRSSISSSGGVGGGREVTDGRASGGLVQPRRTYLVGERGPEYLTMGGTGGRVTSNEAGVAAAGGDTYVYVEIDGEQLQGRIVKTVKQENQATARRVKAGVRP